MFRWLLFCLVLSSGAFALVKYGVPYLQAHNVFAGSLESDDPDVSSGPGPDAQATFDPPALTPVGENQAPSHTRSLAIQEAGLRVTDRQEVPAEREGSLTVIGTEVQPGEKVPERERLFAKVGYLAVAVQPGEQVRPEELIPFEAQSGLKQRYRRWRERDPLKPPGQPELRREGDEAKAPYLIVTEETREFKRLHVGDDVKAGQMVALVDPAIAIKELSSKYAQINAAEAEVLSSRKTKEESARRYFAMRDAIQRLPGSISKDDVEGGRLTWERYAQEEIAKEAAVRKAQQEFLQAATTLQKHEIRATIDGEVTNIYKYRGEAVKNLDPVMQLQNPRHLRIEGLLEVQDTSGLRKGQEVLVEPSRPEQPRAELRGHLQEVTCVAVSAGSIVISGSEDRTLRGWDPKKNGKQLWQVEHKVAPRAVACTAPGAKRNLAVVGWADGTGWLIDLDKPLEVKPRALEGRHGGAVTCVAFSPDGETCATGSDDMSIRLWKTENGELLQSLPKAHKNGLTSLQFAGNNELVSAGRDNVMVQWRIEPGKPPVRIAESDRRGGDVAQLGVTPDGQRVLFDRGKELLVVSLVDRRILGLVQNPANSPNFTTMALFAPDGKTILTNVAADGRLQLWRAPDAVTSRAAEVRQFIWAQSPATCGAFAPDSSFAVTGTKDNLVLVLPMPSREEIDKKLVGRLSLVEPLLQGASRHVRVWATLENPQFDVPGEPGKKAYLLTPGGTATIVVPQQ